MTLPDDFKQTINFPNLFTEEILSSPSAIWMSTDGYLMLFGSFNDSMVEEQKFPWYGTTSSTSGNTNLYPEIRSLRLVAFCVILFYFNDEGM